MNLFNKSPKPQPRQILIPKEHRRRIMELVRDYEKATYGSRSWEHYLLWEGIAELIPEVGTGSWKISIGNALNLSVIEVI